MFGFFLWTLHIILQCIVARKDPSVKRMPNIPWYQHILGCTLIVIPAFFEEMAFRYHLPQLLVYLGFDTYYLPVLTSLSFSLAHSINLRVITESYRVYLQMINTFFLGLYLYSLQDLKWQICAHAGYNLTTYVIIVFTSYSVRTPESIIHCQPHVSSRCQDDIKIGVKSRRYDDYVCIKDMTKQLPSDVIQCWISLFEVSQRRISKRTK